MWKGHHRLRSSDAQGGMSNQANVSVDLWGPEGTSKTDLINLACAICRDRIYYDMPPPADAGAGFNTDVLQLSPLYVNEVDIQDFLDENHISLTMTVTLPSQIWNVGMIDLTGLGTPLRLKGYDRLVARAPSVYGTATTTGRWICYLQTPCDDEHDTKQRDSGQPDSASKYNGGAGTVVQTYTGTVPTPAPQQGTIDGDHIKDQYTHYRIDSEYRTDAGKIALPVARAPGTPSPGDQTSYSAALTQATQLRIIRVEAERLAAWPTIPPPENFTDGNGIYHTFLSSRQIAAAPHLTADGKNYHYSVTMEYTFSMARPLLAADKIESGSLPWDKSKATDQRVEPAKLYDAQIIK